MPVVPMQDLLRPAFAQRYGVGAFNIVDGLTMESVLAAAEAAAAPVIVQVSVKTVRALGPRLIQLMFRELAGRVSTPATLHLDHCTDLALIEACLEAGWNSVLFDGSRLPYEENLAQTRAVTAMARRTGAAVEGELEAVRGVEDGAGGDDEGAAVPLDRAVAFIRETGIDAFAPAIGTAHGLYRAAPRINFARVSEIVAAAPVPIVLHGGTGLSDDVFTDLIARGAAKVNISTQLKITLADGYRDYLNAHPAEYDPPRLFAAVRERVQATVAAFLRVFGSEGRA